MCQRMWRHTIRPMSVEMDPSPDLARPRVSRERLMAIAQTVKVDPRVSQLVPGFDAPFFQAGLAGYSDAPMRLIARRHGCPFCITEALLDLTLINGGKGRTREDPDLLATECGMGELDDNRAAGMDDHPIAGQIMGTHPDTMAKGAALLVGMGYEVIDVNFACPVKKIKKSNRGGHFLTSPSEAHDVLKAVRDAVPAHIPTSVKLRRAWDDTPEMAHNFETVFNACYDLGYAWTTVHCRTVQQKYLGPGKWEFLGDLVERHPDKVIFGSGDVWCVDDIFLMLERTGVAAASVARGCIGNPWIFRQARQMMAGEQPTMPTLEEQRQVLLDHFELSMTLHGERAASRIMRKFGIKFSAHHHNPEVVKGEFIRCTSISDWQAVLAKHYMAHVSMDTRTFKAMA